MIGFATDLPIFAAMEQFASILESWYADHRRELPWRETRDPYRIWISEIILQQTRVAQGEAYYRRFIERFPDVEALAAAPDDEVMKYWQGLGYYSRARHLHAAARSLAGRGFPTDYEGVRALQGVGDYTAAAICSFAYDLPCAVVDGNVYRVLARYFGIDAPIDSSRGKNIFAAMAAEMLDRRHPALYNQAIMEFGALQCTPSAPACLLCPLSDGCQALATGRVGELPVKQHRTKTVSRYFHYLYIVSGSDAFIRRREADDIWRHLYELPLVEADHPLSEEELRHRIVEEWACPNEALASLRPLLRGVKHVLSHRILHTDFYRMEWPCRQEPPAGYQRVPQESLSDYAFPRLIDAFFEKNR